MYLAGPLVCFGSWVSDLLVLVLLSVFVSIFSFSCNSKASLCASTVNIDKMIRCRSVQLRAKVTVGIPYLYLVFSSSAKELAFSIVQLVLA